MVVTIILCVAWVSLYIWAEIRIHALKAAARGALVDAMDWRQRAFEAQSKARILVEQEDARLQKRRDRDAKRAARG
jgi:hypothetical protein